MASFKSFALAAAMAIIASQAEAAEQDSCLGIALSGGGSNGAW